ncbi:hypothetical protein HJG60_010950 [Phyllostomus discolor]|uniref:Uncharacterized protein n=1 Tax=Phyllostomus discolor TaxID=89673 RepID=A0A834AE92_9CHIR|nr:hypothetical protein HJG60_010950 [Phyllostomus discolor]
MPGGGFPAPASLGSHGKIGFGCFSQALGAGGGGPDSSREVAGRRAHPLAQSLTKPLGERYVIMGRFGMWGEQLWTGGRSPELQPFFCPKPQMWSLESFAPLDPPRKEPWRIRFPTPDSCLLGFPGSLTQAQEPESKG